jgi:hypothetical protein
MEHDGYIYRVGKPVAKEIKGLPFYGRTSLYHFGVSFDQPFHVALSSVLPVKDRIRFLGIGIYGCQYHDRAHQMLLHGNDLMIFQKI